jgi:hypothetical protein
MTVRFQEGSLGQENLIFSAGLLVSVVNRQDLHQAQDTIILCQQRRSVFCGHSTRKVVALRKKYVVELAEDERRTLKRLISRGSAPARKLNRARILLKAARASTQKKPYSSQTVP